MRAKHCPQQMAASVSHLPATKLSLLEQLSVGRHRRAINKWSRTYLAFSVQLPSPIQHRKMILKEHYLELIQIGRNVNALSERDVTKRRLKRKNRLAR